MQKAAQLEFGLKDSLHPPRSQRLEMPHEFQQTQCPCVLQPQRRPSLWTQRLMQHNEEHSPIQITEGGVFFCGRERGSMERALPGLQNEFYVPAQRVHVHDGRRRPYGGRYVGNKEGPGHQRQVGLRRCVALFLGVLPRHSSAFIDNCLGHTHGNETRSDTLCGPKGDRGLEAGDIGLDCRTPLRQLYRTQTTGRRFRDVGRMIEATEKIRANSRNAGQGLALTIA